MGSERMNMTTELKKEKVCRSCGAMMKLYDKDENIRGLRVPKQYSDMFYGCSKCTMAVRVDLTPTSSGGR